MGFPVDLRLDGRRVVVVGAGPIATRKIRQLLERNADIVVVAPGATDTVTSLAASGTITWHRRHAVESDFEAAWLIVTATGDPEIDAWVFAYGEANQIWVNSADDPANCSVTLLSILRRGDLVVAVGSSGRAPAVATWVRTQIGARIDPAYGLLVDLVAEIRAHIHERGLSTEGFDWQDVLATDVVDQLRCGDRAAARRKLLERLGMAE
ncbi:MAG: bifunctional precorrin-2 dehydrogenase/sirohydrochlorin ferrochelatase [Actinobacteria bacterium]|nr:bifunctional precorrin-2 dehydrogenase/sirohydrochlorin ferrochelatase [Actinomycetota bacterium]MCB9390414.1 bifunctional precorrin-2 dehydrogenase/sirohydrochlorin ferrochelatase [Acidimicrobiia bacterium]